MAEAAEPRLIRAAERLTAGEIQRTHRIAVIAPPPGNDDGPVGFVAGQVVTPDELQAALDGLGAAADRIDGRVVHGEPRTHGSSVRLKRLVGEAGAVDVREGSGLALHRVHNGTATVAHIHDDRAPGGIQVRPPIGVPNCAALGSNGDR